MPSHSSEKGIIIDILGREHSGYQAVCCLLAWPQSHEKRRVDTDCKTLLRFIVFSSYTGLTGNPNWLDVVINFNTASKEPKCLHVLWLPYDIKAMLDHKLYMQKLITE